MHVSRSSGMLTGSKVVDAQSGYESAFNMLPILLAGANLVLHTAGWTEAGLTDVVLVAVGCDYFMIDFLEFANPDVRGMVLEEILPKVR